MTGHPQRQIITIDIHARKCFPDLLQPGDRHFFIRTGGCHEPHTSRFVVLLKLCLQIVTQCLDHGLAGFLYSAAVFEGLQLAHIKAQDRFNIEQ